MLKNIVTKILSLYVILRFGKLHHSLRYYYRDTYYCKFIQLKYYFKDYWLKKPYKEISFNGEFAPDLEFALPFAYWHYKNGTLKKTAGPQGTKDLYFFSENHAESFGERNVDANYNYEIPRVLYSHDYDIDKWARVPLKEHYQNDIFKFDKPTLIIANRYNIEWDRGPISFYSIEMLDFMMSTLKDKYTIVYNRPRANMIAMDNSDILDLNEFEWIKSEHPEVILMEDLYKQHKANVNSFNHLQMLVYANALHFISIHGGTATLASYFKGTNLVLSKEGPEHHFGCFEKLFPKLSGATILHAKDDAEVRTFIQNHY